MHIETNPKVFPVLNNSGSNVAICLEPNLSNFVPVHPRGCPNAIAPPLGLSFLGHIPKIWTQ